MMTTLLLLVQLLLVWRMSSVRVSGGEFLREVMIPVRVGEGFVIERSVRSFFRQARPMS